MDVSGEILDDDLLRRIRIAEPDVLKAHLSLDIRQLLRLPAFIGQLLAF